MSNFICTVNGTRDRNLDLYDNKCVEGKTQGDLPARFSSFRSKRTDVCQPEFRNLEVSGRPRLYVS